MGYTTEFQGSFKLDRKLDDNHHKYLDQFAYTRRICRKVDVVSQFKDPIRQAVNLPIGNDGGYYVGSFGDFGQAKDNLLLIWFMSIVDYNTPPKGQPSLWNHWVPSDDGLSIIWDNGEKFYKYNEWIIYLIDNFLQPWGYVVNGTCRWQGEDPQDVGKIVIVNNVVDVLNYNVFK